MSLRQALCAVLTILAVGAVPAGSGPPLRRIAFVVESWYPRSHADVVGTRLLEGYRIGNRTYSSPVTIASVYPEDPRSDDQTRMLAAKHGFRVASSIAEALLDDPRVPAPRLAVDGIFIATREDPPRAGQTASPTPRLKTFREILRILDLTGARVPIFLDKLVAANWNDSLTIVAAARSRGIPLMGGSVLSYMPLDRPLMAPDGRAVSAVLAGGPYWAHAFHAAELLQAHMERRGTRETGIATVRDAGATYWSMADRNRWGGSLLDVMLERAATRSGRGLPPQAGPEGGLVLFQYADGARAVLALFPRAVDESEFVLGSRFADGRLAVGGVQFQGPPFDHFAYLVHALIQFYVSGQAAVPIERTLLATGMVLHGLQARGQEEISTPSMVFSYTISR